MSKYANAISYWEHDLVGIKHKLKPTEEDNLDFLRLKKKAEKADDETILFKGISNIYFDMVIRSYPELTEQDQKDLKEVIGQNTPTLVNDMMIAFKWTTQEEIDKIKANAFQKKEGK